MALMNTRPQRYREQVYTHPEEHQLALPPIRVTTVLVSRWGPGDRFERINRPVVSLNLVTRGNLSYRQRGKQGTVNAGELFIAHKGCDQVFETGDAGFLHKRTLLVDGIGLHALMQVTGLTAVDRVTVDDPARVARLFRRCYRTMREKPSGFAGELSNLAYAILNECCRSLAARRPFPLCAAIEYLEQNIQRTLTLAQIAAAAGVSVRQCTRLFRKHVGSAPMSFFIDLKMNSAKVLLSVSSLSIKQVGTEVGYDDPYHFSSQFKQRTGQSPQAFRRAAQA
jgi:AraC-like DNA-binding protein